MIQARSVFHFSLFLLVVCGLCLQGCASRKDTEKVFKTGMHIDAVLEFAIEYPLFWTKDRRITYGSSNGEIRWKPPKYDGTLLRLNSEKQDQNTLDPELQLTRLLQEFVDLEISLNERTPLPAGKATHIIGETSEEHIEIYQLSHNNRSYLISLATLKENISLYEGVMNKVIPTFQVLQ
jgi:hypothetical protein